MSRRRKHLKTRTNASGYAEYWDDTEGRWRLTHRRVAEKKMGGQIRLGYEVHHKNGDKRDNRPENLVTLPKGEHRDVHRIKREIEGKRERARTASPRAKRAIYREVDELRDEVEHRENYYRGGRRW